MFVWRGIRNLYLKVPHLRRLPLKWTIFGRLFVIQWNFTVLMFEDDIHLVDKLHHWWVILIDELSGRNPGGCWCCLLCCQSLEGLIDGGVLLLIQVWWSLWNGSFVQPAATLRPNRWFLQVFLTEDDFSLLLGFLPNFQRYTRSLNLCLLMRLFPN